MTFKLNTPETKHLSLLKCQPISFSSYGALIIFNYRDDLFEMTDTYIFVELNPSTRRDIYQNIGVPNWKTRNYIKN